MSGRGRRPSVFAIVVGAVVVLGIVAIVLTRQDVETTPDVTASVDIEGEPLPTFVGPPDRALGLQAPIIEGATLDGEPLTLAANGRPMAIAFLAHWCPHCQQEVTELVAWLEDNELPSGIDLYAVSTLVDRTRGNFPPDAWLEDEGWPVPTLSDDANNRAANAFGLAGTPFWVFLNADGTVASRTSGVIGPEALAGALGDLTEAPTDES